MKRLSWALLLVAAIVAAFLAGRFTTVPRGETGNMPASSVDSEAIVRGAQSDAAAQMAPRPGGPGKVVPSSPARQPAEPVAVGLSADPAATPVQVSGGPQPMAQEDAPKLARTEAHLAAEGGTWADLLELAANEDGDAEARRLEQLIAQSILRHGDRYTLLRLAPPHCTRSVCLMRGVGGGRGNDPRSDWQRLSAALMNEPWFRESFDDMRTSVSSEGDETVYVTLYVRCAPGTCRLGKR